MKKLCVLIAALIVLIPSLAYSDMFTVRLGYYMPRAFGNSYLASHPNGLFAIELNQMTFQASDFRGSILGLGYEFFLTPQFSLAISADYFDKENGGSYRDYTGITVNTTDFPGDWAFPFPTYTGDFEIQHSMHVSMIPVQLSIKFTPLGRKTRVIPYIGGGVGLYFLHASLNGEIVDFSGGQLVNDPARPELGDFTIYPIALSYLRDNHAIFGGHAFAGIMVPIGYRLTLEAEGRYHYAKATLGGGFIDLGALDLSGVSISIGLNYWF